MLLSVASAVPANVFTQGEAVEAAEQLFADRFPDFRRMRPVYVSAGIDKRHSVMPIDWYLKQHGWGEASEVYLAAATDLFAEVAAKALAKAGLSGSDVDTIVTVSSTGIATPSLEARAAGRMGFRADVERVPVFGLGCAGGVTGFSIASRLARARPGTNVLLVAVELCSLAFRPGDASKANIVATALFGDGAAACVIRAGEAGLASVEAGGEHMWPDTLDIMGWDVGNDGLGVIFAQSIPAFAEKNMGAAMTGMLGRADLQMSDIDRFICHPGGTKVVAAIETAFGLNQGSLDHERAILREYGNMSAPTVLFVLERALEAGLPVRSALTAMGPGFTASCAVLQRAA
jgi:alkylresorcinol/alkylpyrone synthase